LPLAIQFSQSNKMSTIKQIFDAFPLKGKTDAIDGLTRIWDGEPLTSTQQTYLEGIFEQFPLGQTNFNIWLKQTLRQRFERDRDLLNIGQNVP